MNTTEKHIYLLIGGFILDHRQDMIRFLNENGYASLAPNSSLEAINDAVAYHITDSNFVIRLVTLIAEKNGGDKYSNYTETIAKVPGFGEEALKTGGEAAGSKTPWGMIAAVVMEIAGGINSMIIAAKNALFQRQMAQRQELEDRRLTEWQKAQAELNAKKQFSINLGISSSVI